jgi:hypothetical protein
VVEEDDICRYSNLISLVNQQGDPFVRLSFVIPGLTVAGLTPRVVLFFLFAILHCFLEFKDTLADTSCQSGYFPRSEQQNENEYYYRPFQRT